MNNDVLYHDTIVVVKLSENNCWESKRYQFGNQYSRPIQHECKRRKCMPDSLTMTGREVEGTQGRQTEDGEDPDMGNIRFTAAAFNLASSSPYFSSVLERWSGSQGSRKIVEVQVAEGDLIALQLLLRFIHHGEFPVSISEESLLRLLLLADRYMVDKLIPFCCKHLIQTGFDWKVASQILTLFGAPRHNLLPATKYLMEAADKVLLEEFPDLETLWMAPNTRKLFLELPLAGIKSLLMSEGVRVGGEETVFWAVSEWLQHHFEGKSANPENESYIQTALELGNCVRFPQISGSYLHSIVPQAMWMRHLEVSSAWVEDALEFQALNAREREGIKQQLWRRDRRFRSRPGSPVPKLLTTWKISADDLRLGVMTQTGMASPDVRYRGYVWSLQCELTRKGAADSGLMVGLYVSAPHGTESQRMGWAGQQLQVSPEAGVRKVTFLAATRSGIHHEVAVECNEWKMGDGYCIPDFFKCSLESLLAADSRFVIDGQIALSVRISADVDRCSIHTLRRRLAPVPEMEIVH